MKKFEPKMCWDSDVDNIIDDFYLPGLKNSIQYDRLAGYFSSTLFVRIAREIIDFVQEGGLVRIVTSATLSRVDLDVVTNLDANKHVTDHELLTILQSTDNDIEHKCKSLFGWLLKHKINGRPQLEIRIAIPRNSTGIFHQKVGVFVFRDGKSITFSGSVNETIKGWQDNVEQLKVFKSWGDTTNQDAVKNDQDNFNRCWNDLSTSYKIIELPVAVTNYLVSIAPKSEFELNTLLKYLNSKFYQSRQLPQPSIQLRDYQETAITSWEKNNHQGMFAMATGTGKTYAALGAISHLLQKCGQRTIIIISSPQIHIADQWKDAIWRWNNGVAKTSRIPEQIIMAHSENTKWKHELSTLAQKFNRKLIASKKFLVNNFIICTTHNTFATEDFLKKINEAKDNNADVLLIVDEAHGAGSKIRQRGLSREYKYRLGLSATPIRHYDEAGTETIKSYFSRTVYEMTLPDAISRGYLVPYLYYPHYVDLTDDELTAYRDLTIKLAKKHEAQKKGEPIPDDNTRLEEIRANIIANAVNKYDKFKEIIGEYNNLLSHCLIYCHPDQINNITNILTDRNIVNEKITWEYPSRDRKRIIDALKNEQYQCVTAIRCLDEGYDIPSARMAIILSSSGDPRQYIQRRGRVLRRSPGKDYAEIHDVLVKPSLANLQGRDLRAYIKKMVARELLRHKEFASAALNKNDAYHAVRITANNCNIDLDELSNEYINSIY